MSVSSRIPARASPPAPDKANPPVGAGQRSSTVRNRLAALRETRSSVANLLRWDPAGEAQAFQAAKVSVPRKNGQTAVDDASELQLLHGGAAVLALAGLTAKPGAGLEPATPSLPCITRDPSALEEGVDMATVSVRYIVHDVDE